MAFADPGDGRRVQACVPTGGRTRLTLKAAESCVKGDIIGYSSGWMRALATVGTAIQGRFVALTDGAGGEEIEAATHAIVWAYTGATPNADIYVAEGTLSGEVTETAPTTTGDCNTIIGIATAADTIKFFLNSRADSLA